MSSKAASPAAHQTATATGTASESESIAVDGHQLDVTGLNTRERALKVALVLFAHNGYEATSLREIADALGFTKAALYYHFPSKDAIVDALVEQRLALWAEFDRISKDSGPEQILDQLADLIRSQGADTLRLYSANGHVKNVMRSRITDTQSVDRLLRVLARGSRRKEDIVRARLAMWMVWTSVMTLEPLDLTDEQRIEYAVAAAKDLVRER